MKSLETQVEMSSTHLTRAGSELRRELWAEDETLGSSAYGGDLPSLGTGGFAQEERKEQGKRTAYGYTEGREAHTVPRGRPRD